MLIRSAACMLLTVATASVAQFSPSSTRIYGTSDRDIPTPLHSTKTSSDAGALQQFVEFVQASGVSGWKGMTAGGTITLGGQTQSLPAHLYLRDSTASRLDIEKSGGMDSMIFSGDAGVSKTLSQKRISVSSDLARLGFVAFPRLLSADYPSSTSILTDGGTVNISGASLHRITLDDPATDTTGNIWKTVDLYFDPATNHLVQGVSFVHLSPSDAALYMVETSYDDYRTEGQITLPHRITQSLNGNIAWTLQLEQLDLTSVPPVSTFSF